MKNIIKTPSFIRISVLTVLQALYDGFLLIVILLLSYACYAVLSFMNVSFESVEAVMLVVCALIPSIMGFFLVDRPKWWLISLPAQLVLDTVALHIFLYVFLNDDPNPADDILIFGTPSFGEILIFSIFLSMFFLALQSAGVGIKALWLKLKAWRNAPKT